MNKSMMKSRRKMTRLFKKTGLKLGVILALLLFGSNMLNAQLFEIEGQAKIMEMTEQNNCDSVVVRTTDGTLAIRHASTLGGGGDQMLSISQDTIYLSDGGFVKLPPDAINDNDSDAKNELQNLSYNGDTIFIQNKNYIVIPGLKNLPYLNISVQERLNRGATPSQIYQNGYPLDSLYGKIYKGGMIFYIDPLDTLAEISGLVADISDIEVTGNFLHPWGCLSTDPLPFPTGNEIGKGATNTDSIVMNGCAGAGDAGILADSHATSDYSDWFLPSRDELEIIYNNIGPGAPGENQNIGNFELAKYWSSTPSADNGSWQVDFSNGAITGFSRSQSLRVRPVRAF